MSEPVEPQLLVLETDVALDRADEREWEHGAEHGLVERGVGGEIHHGGEVDVDREQRLAPLGVAGR